MKEGCCLKTANLTYLEEGSGDLRIPGMLREQGAFVEVRTTAAKVNIKND